MDAIECIASRRSIRKYSNAPVEWDKVVQVITAGMQAPSAGNAQECRFIVITEAEKRTAMARVASEQWWIAEAPIIIVVCADVEKIKRLYGIRGERLYSIQDSAAAIENMLIAAHSLGLGACWIGSFDENALQRELEIPDHVRIQAMVPLGYADESPKDKESLMLTNSVFFEKYGNRIKNMDAVFWNTRILSNAIDKGKNAIENIRLHSRKINEKIAEKLRRKK